MYRFMRLLISVGPKQMVTQVIIRCLQFAKLLNKLSLPLNMSHTSVILPEQEFQHNCHCASSWYNLYTYFVSLFQNLTLLEEEIF